MMDRVIREVVWWVSSTMLFAGAAVLVGVTAFGVTCVVEYLWGL